MSILESINQAVKETENFRIKLTFDDGITDTAFDPLATQEFLQGLTFLHAAELAFRKASILQARNN